MSATLILSVTTLVGATISGVIGMGGGILLLAVMASVLDPIAVVPVHGVVQLVSNSSRGLRLLPHVNRRFVAFYTPMLLVGAAVGIGLYRGASAPWFRPAVGAFVLLVLLWERLEPERLRAPDWVLVPAGFVGGLLTVLVGATGPYLAAFFLRDDMTRREIVATKAAVQTFGHLVKIPAFLSIGFAYREHLLLIGPLVVCAVLGTLLGTAVLGRLNEQVFRRAFRVVLLVLAVRLVWRGLA